jgi:anti-sigma B factor antagonist
VPAPADGVKPLTITSTSEENGVRVVFTGELDIGGAQSAEDVLRRVESDGAPTLTIDLRGLTFMDSTGLRMLVAADKRAHEAGRTLRIVRGPAPVQRILDLTGLGDKLPIVDE